MVNKKTPVNPTQPQAPAAPVQAVSGPIHTVVPRALLNQGFWLDNVSEIEAFQRLAALPVTGKVADVLPALTQLSTQNLTMTDPVDVSTANPTGLGRLITTADPANYGALAINLNRLNDIKAANNGVLPVETDEVKLIVANTQMWLRGTGEQDLPVTGVWDARTEALTTAKAAAFNQYNAASNAYSIILNPAMLVDLANPSQFNSANIKSLQTSLVSMGLYTGDPTGAMDAQTLDGINKLTAALPKKSIDADMDATTATIIREAVALQKRYGSENPSIVNPANLALEIYGVQYGLTEKVDGRRDMVVMRNIGNDFKLKTDRVLGAADLEGFVNNTLQGVGYLTDATAKGLFEGNVRGMANAWATTGQGLANGTLGLVNIVASASNATSINSIIEHRGNIVEGFKDAYETNTNMVNKIPGLNPLLHGNPNAITGVLNGTSLSAGAYNEQVNTIGLAAELVAPVPPVMGIAKLASKGLRGATVVEDVAKIVNVSEDMAKIKAPVALPKHNPARGFPSWDEVMVPAGPNGKFTFGQKSLQEQFAFATNEDPLMKGLLGADGQPLPKSAPKVEAPAAPVTRNVSEEMTAKIESLGMTADEFYAIPAIERAKLLKDLPEPVVKMTPAQIDEAIAQLPKQTSNALKKHNIDPRAYVQASPAEQIRELRTASETAGGIRTAGGVGAEKIFSAISTPGGLGKLFAGAGIAFAAVAGIQTAGRLVPSDNAGLRLALDGSIGLLLDNGISDTYKNISWTGELLLKDITDNPEHAAAYLRRELGLALSADTGSFQDDVLIGALRHIATKGFAGTKSIEAPQIIETYLREQLLIKPDTAIKDALADFVTRPQQLDAATSKANADVSQQNAANAQQDAAAKTAEAQSNTRQRVIDSAKTGRGWDLNPN